MAAQPYFELANKRDFPTDDTSSDAFPDGIFPRSRFRVESFDTNRCTTFRAINRWRDLILVKRNDVRLAKFFHNQIEHSELQALEVNWCISDPVHVNPER